MLRPPRSSRQHRLTLTARRNLSGTHPFAITAMNVQQLIEELQKYPPEMRVIVDGYDGGYSNCEPPESTRIRLNVHGKDKWYYGRHDDENYPGGNRDGAIETALLLPRPYRDY